MGSIIIIGVFIVVAVVLNYIVNLIFNLLSKKTKEIHLRFLRGVANVIVNVVIIYSLAQQFEITKDISKVLLQAVL